MKRMKLFYLLSGLIGLAKCSFVINCTFPCSVLNQICHITTESIQCEEKSDNLKWIVEGANKLPIYKLGQSGLGQRCEIAPIINLVESNHATNSHTQTVVNWPLEGYDSFLSNCSSTTYCDTAKICVKKLEHGEPCESSNQCMNGSCIKSICGSVKRKQSKGLTTIHIIVVVIGSILFVCLVVGIFIFYKKKYSDQKNRINKKHQKLKTPPLFESSTSDSDPSISQHTVVNVLHHNYDQHFSLDNTPTIQQQQLQYQLQMQLVNNNQQSPPPYSP